MFFADHGGGVSVVNGSPVFADCLFESSTAVGMLTMLLISLLVLILDGSWCCSLGNAVPYSTWRCVFCWLHIRREQWFVAHSLFSIRSVV
jgi:hypothetical protein